MFTFFKLFKCILLIFLIFKNASYSMPMASTNMGAYQQHPQQMSNNSSYSPKHYNKNPSSQVRFQRFLKQSLFQFSRIARIYQL